MPKTEAKAVEPQSSRPKLPVRGGRVVVSELATYLAVDRSNLRRILIKAGYKMELMPFPQAGNQRVLTLTEADARAYLAASDGNPLSGRVGVDFID